MFLNTLPSSSECFPFITHSSVLTVLPDWLTSISPSQDGAWVDQSSGCTAMALGFALRELQRYFTENRHRYSAIHRLIGVYFDPLPETFTQHAFKNKIDALHWMWMRDHDILAQPPDVYDGYRASSLFLPGVHSFFSSPDHAPRLSEMTLVAMLDYPHRFAPITLQCTLWIMR